MIRDFWVTSMQNDSNLRDGKSGNKRNALEKSPSIRQFEPFRHGAE